MMRMESVASVNVLDLGVLRLCPIITDYIVMHVVSITLLSLALSQ